MAFQPIRKAYRTFGHLRRLRRIMSVLVRYGMDDLVRRVGLDTWMRRGLRFFWRRGAKSEPQPRTFAMRVRLALQELGPTFVKLGQTLSTRDDLFPPDIVDELAVLQDDVPAEPFDVVQQVLDQEGIDAKLEAAGATLDPQPVAAASMAQVHYATLATGERIVLKVQRPGIEETMLADLRLLEDLATILERDDEIRETFRPSAVVREFERSVVRELDFSLEGRTMDRVRRNFAGDETVHVPRVHWSLTSRRVLAMEFCDGIKIDRIENLRAAGHDLERIAHRGADAMLKQIFEDGLFHGDPHPGNLRVLPDDVIGFLDFGIVGRLDEPLRDVLVDLLLAIVRGDAATIVDVALAAGQVPDEVDLRSLRCDIEDLLDLFRDVPLGQLQMAEVFAQFFATLQRHRIGLPQQLVLLARTIAIIESVGRELDPEFDLVSRAEPFVRRVIRQRMSAGEIADQVVGTFRDLARLARKTPADLARILDMIKRNDLHLGFRHEGLDDLATEIDRSSNRLAFGVIIASLIVGSSILVQARVGPTYGDVPLLGVAGYLVAGLMGLRLAFAILRSGRL